MSSIALIAIGAWNYVTTIMLLRCKKALVMTDASPSGSTFGRLAFVTMGTFGEPRAMSLSA